MSRTSIKQLTVSALLLMGALVITPDCSEASEPYGQIPVQKVGLFHRTGWCWFSGASDAPATNGALPVYECLEIGDVPLAPWDRAGRVSGLCNRWYARHEEKKAWHYYIRGTGPAIHERSPGRPCLW